MKTSADFDTWLDSEIAKVVSRPRVITSGKRWCSKCGDEMDRKRARYCKKCHREYMKEWRKTHKYVKVSSVY